MVVLSLAIGILLLAVLVALTYKALWEVLTPERTSGISYGRQRVDGDVLFSDDRLNELLYAHPPSYDTETLDFDPNEVPTRVCTDCQALNREEYDYCRECAGRLEA